MDSCFPFSLMLFLSSLQKTYLKKKIYQPFSVQETLYSWTLLVGKMSDIFCFSLPKSWREFCHFSTGPRHSRDEKQNIKNYEKNESVLTTKMHDLFFGGFFFFIKKYTYMLLILIKNQFNENSLKAIPITLMHLCKMLCQLLWAICCVSWAISAN